MTKVSMGTVGTVPQFNIAEPWKVDGGTVLTWTQEGTAPIKSRVTGNKTTSSTVLCVVC